VIRNFEGCAMRVRQSSLSRAMRVLSLAFAPRRVDAMAQHPSTPNALQCQ
jgi:hypothetical protein